MKRQESHFRCLVVSKVEINFLRFPIPRNPLCLSRFVSPFTFYFSHFLKSTEKKAKRRKQKDSQLFSIRKINGIKDS